MQLQPASKKEVTRMAAGCGICAGIEVAVFGLVRLLGYGEFSYRVVLGALGGTAVAVLNFMLMCLMVQNAAGIQDQKLLKAKVQGSYNLRILFQATWVAAAFFIPFVNVIAAAIPLLFPTAVIYFLQITGRLLPKSSSPAPAREPAPEEEQSQDDLNSFEV